MSISRRNFLQGTAACAAAAAIPVPSLAPLAPLGSGVAYRAGAAYPLFAGEIGVYNGIIFREVPALPVASPGMLRQLEYLAQPWGFVTATVLEGVESDGG